MMHRDTSETRKAAVTVIFFALFVILASLGDFPGHRAAVVFTATLMVAAAFMILVTTADRALSEAKSAAKNRVAERADAVATQAGRRGGWGL